MSWWVKNVESFYRPPESAYTSKRATIICDTPQDLPAYNERQSDENDPFILMYGSDADVISNGRKYILNGSNEWIIQPQSGGGGGGSSEAVDINYDNSQSGLSATNVQAAIDELEDEIDSIVPGGDVDAEDVGYNNITSGLTATNVQDAIDELHDTDETQDNALVELYAENDNQQLEINYSINTGSKNLLEYNGYGTGAENGVTYVINSDGTITVNGTPQGSSPSYIELKLNGNAANISRFCDGNHILSGCPAGGSDSTYRMYAARSTYSRFDYGNGVLLTDTTITDVRLVVYIANGYTANNLVFKPMIRRAEIKDSTFEPYAPTNRELYEMILALQSGRSLQSLHSPMTLNLDRNDLNEQLDRNFDLIDSIPEEEEGDSDV